METGRTSTSLDVILLRLDQNGEDLKNIRCTSEETLRDVQEIKVNNAEFRVGVEKDVNEIRERQAGYEKRTTTLEEEMKKVTLFIASLEPIKKILAWFSAAVVLLVIGLLWAIFTGQIVLTYVANTAK